MDDPVEIGENGEPPDRDRHDARDGDSRDCSRCPSVQAAGATVIIMPIAQTDKPCGRPNRLRETRSSTAGVFTVKGLPPGEYLAVAIDDAVAEGWQDERVVARLRTLAIRFTLRRAESKQLNLRVSALRR